MGGSDPVLSTIAWIFRGIAILLIARALTSWFPDIQKYQIVQILYDLTDPIIQPIRKLIPPVGMLDLSTMIAVFFFWFVAGIIETAGS